MGRKNFGFSLIEALIATAIIGILSIMAFWGFKYQLAKARDAQRKNDLEKMQKALEDYMNDKGCYPNPDEIRCGATFTPYLKTIPCDPLNNSWYNYFYSYDDRETCKSWYKIYVKLENNKDPIIEKVGCGQGCGPSGNYNYWVSSPNMNEVAQTPGEDWWPPIGVSPPPSSPFPSLSLTPSYSPTPSFIPVPSEGPYYGCFGGICRKIEGELCTPNYLDPNCYFQCGTPEEPKNECQ